MRKGQEARVWIGLKIGAMVCLLQKQSC